MAPRLYKLTDVTRQTVLAERLARAGSAWQRVVGLLGRRGMEHGEGLWLDPCNGVHTLGMRFTIDVVTLDQDRRIVGIAERVRPWRIVWPVRRGRSVLELPTGAVARAGAQVGDEIQFMVVG